MARELNYNYGTLPDRKDLGNQSERIKLINLNLNLMNWKIKKIKNTNQFV